MGNLLLSADTMQEWSVEEIIQPKKQTSAKQLIEKLELNEIYENRQKWYFQHRLALMERYK